MQITSDSLYRIVFDRQPEQMPRLTFPYVTTFHERKEARREHFEKYVKGWKLRGCVACSGSGRYDHHGAPRCGACDGVGKERYKPGV